MIIAQFSFPFHGHLQDRIVEVGFDGAVVSNLDQIPASDLSRRVAQIFPGEGEDAAVHIVGRKLLCDVGELFISPAVGDGDAGSVSHGLVVEDLEGVAGIGDADDLALVGDRTGCAGAEQSVEVVAEQVDVFVHGDERAVDGPVHSVGAAQVGDVDGLAAGDHGVEVLQVVLVNQGAQLGVLDLDIGILLIPHGNELLGLVVLVPASADPDQGAGLQVSARRVAALRGLVV